MQYVKLRKRCGKRTEKGKTTTCWGHPTGEGYSGGPARHTTPAPTDMRPGAL